MTTVILTTSDLDAVARWAAASIRTGVIDTVHVAESPPTALQIMRMHVRAQGRPDYKDTL